jgi:peptidoglycan/LPS O-acetylase OafA/YrhL
MIELLLLLIVIASCFVNRREKFAALCFGLVNSLFCLFDDSFNDQYYYIATTFFDASLSLILYIVWMTTKSKLSVILLASCIISVLINIYGFAAYLAYSKPFIYNSLFELYYISIIVLMISRINPDARDNSRRRHIRFSSDDNNSLLHEGRS